MTIDRINSGSEMPSMPRWYRAWMTSIHCLFDLELQLSAWS